MTKPTTLSTIFRTVTAATAAAVLLSGCSRAVIKPANESAPIPTNEYQYQHELNMIDDNYRNYYQIFVYSFCDSNGDGIGDLNGVTSKLDYIQDMGFNGIWLTPIMSSSSYHKYSVDDYYSIDPQYGTMDDFQNLADECSKRG
ncbi:MAG: alpha-amylase family glycosyl hydrolase, partial [Oscillospiraceae bacterium]